MGALAGGVAEFAVAIFFLGSCVIEFVADASHGDFGARHVFLGSEEIEAFLGGELHVDADTVCVAGGFFDELGGGFGDGF